MSPESFGKRQREKARKEKAASKAARRAERIANSEEAEVVDSAPPGDEQALIAELADLHERFDEGTVDFEEFAAAKEELVQKLQRL